jgi:hypothetical protein
LQRQAFSRLAWSLLVLWRVWQRPAWPILVWPPQDSLLLVWRLLVWLQVSPQPWQALWLQLAWLPISLQAWSLAWPQRFLPQLAWLLQASQQLVWQRL